MIGKITETFVVVIKLTPLKKDYYKVEFGDAEGEIFEILVHAETVLEYRLVLGKEIDKQTFEKLLTLKDFQSAYGYALNILGRRMYTTTEIKRKLAERDFDAPTIKDVVAKLFEINLLNDFFYATAYIEEHVGLMKKSKRRIISDLQTKGIDRETIDELSHLFDHKLELELINIEIEKEFLRFSKKNLNDFELQDKVLKSLVRKGFDFNQSRTQYKYFKEDLAWKEAQNS